MTDFKNINVAPFWTDAGSFEGYEEDFHKFVRNGTVLNGQGFSHVSSMSDLEIKNLLKTGRTDFLKMSLNSYFIYNCDVIK